MFQILVAHPEDSEFIAAVAAGHADFGLSQLDEDAGKFRVKAWKLATWKTNQ